MVNAITTLSLPLIRGSVLLPAVSFSLVNLMIDMLYACVGPSRFSAHKGVLFRTFCRATV